MLNKKMILLLLIGLSFFACQQDDLNVSVPELPDEFPILRGAYLGQEPPGTTPVLFAPEFFRSVELHHIVSFTSEGDRMYYSLMSGGDCIKMMRTVDGLWQEPVSAPFLTGDDTAADQSISADGEKMFVFSNRSHSLQGLESGKENIWYFTLENGEWVNPRIVEKEINTFVVHWGCSVALSNNLYFSGKVDRDAEGDIYISKFENNVYLPPVKLDVNTDDNENTPYIASDESYLIFSRTENNYRSRNLYICFKNPDGTWREAVKLPSPINSSSYDFSPTVTLDGKYFFFLSDRIDGNQANPYWVDIQVIEDLRPIS